jgi:glycerol-3-phosphate acyltransferase PlsY
MDVLAAAVAGYLLGSLPFGYWVGLLRGIDLRAAGSGNTGATNALRLLGRRMGVLVMALDIAKGAGAVLIGHALGGVDAGVAAAFAAVIGHAFPVFLGFRGGKAVATGAGAMLALAPVTAVIAISAWFAIALATRYVSLASLLVAVLFPVLTVVFGNPWPVVAFATAAGLFVIWRHRANLSRLRDGTEHRLSLRGAR